MGTTSVRSFTTHEVAERFVAHGPPLSFRELCTEVLSPKTRYLVLDLDGTIHLRRNLGELLGWELSAYRGYGLQTMERLEPGRHSARWLLDWGDPGRLFRYVFQAALAWTKPGMSYLVWGKLASRVPQLRKAGFRRFHSDPIRSAQEGVQTTLMGQLESTPDELVPILMERIWQRHRDDQVITAEDIDWIRANFPNTEVVLSSASPQPVVSFVAKRLDIEHAHGSTPGRINSGEAKIEMLESAFDDFGDPGIEIVGISDTAHGDDHCWTRYFTKVVDINSPAPFPPIAPVGSPLQEVHSATVLSREELARRASEPEHLSPRRAHQLPGARRELAGADLRALMESLVQQFNAIGLGPATDPVETAYQLSVLRESSRDCLA
jgi:hypothetical protein